MSNYNLLPPDHPNPPAADDTEVIRREAEGLIANAQRLGLIVTIEQRPLRPLAMGHYETVVSVRPARQPA